MPIDMRTYPSDMSAAALSAGVSSLLVLALDRDMRVSAYPRLTAINPKPCLFWRRSINCVEGGVGGGDRRGTGVGCFNHTRHVVREADSHQTKATLNLDTHQQL